MRKRFRYLRERKKALPRALILGLPGLLLAAAMSQAAFATTYVITDGGRTYSCTAFTDDPAQILDRAGLELDEYDSYTTGETTITINRAQSILLIYHGHESRISSDGETVGRLLRRLELELVPEDVLSVPEETETYDGMVLRIDRVLQKNQTYTVALPGTIRYCNADALPTGTETVLVSGRDGALRRTAEVTYINGIETRREITSETLITAPRDAIIATGSGAPIPPFDLHALPRIDSRTITLPTGEVLTYTHTADVRATAYTHTDEGCNNITATGSRVHIGTVAVDPRVIPYGTRMFIMASDGSYVYGIAEAEDCGGDIIGDRMDLYLPTYEDCIAFGRRVCTVYFLG